MLIGTSSNKAFKLFKMMSLMTLKHKVICLKSLVRILTLQLASSFEILQFQEFMLIFRLSFHGLVLVYFIEGQKLKVIGLCLEVMRAKYFGYQICRLCLIGELPEASQAVF